MVLKYDINLWTLRNYLSWLFFYNTTFRSTQTAHGNMPGKVGIPCRPPRVGGLRAFQLHSINSHAKFKQ